VGCHASLMKDCLDSLFNNCLQIVLLIDYMLLKIILNVGAGVNKIFRW